MDSITCFHETAELTFCRISPICKLNYLGVMEIHMSRFVTNAGNIATAAIMAGGVAACVAEGDGG